MSRLVYRPVHAASSWAVALWFVGIGHEHVHHLLEPELNVAPCDSQDSRHLKAVVSGDACNEVTCDECRSRVTRTL